jgi:digeranylgeranylglycerophospholipid reductase
MSSTERVDVLIAGAGTAGSYLAWRLADRGYDCLVLEAQPLDRLGVHIGPFHMEEVAFERFGIPEPEGDELLGKVESMTMWSPGRTEHLTFGFPTLVMEKPLFMRRLHRYARGAGATIVDNTRISGPVLEGGFLRGVIAQAGGGEVEYRARLVIDASGVDGAVRTRMPAGGWVEADALSGEDTIYVYMESWKVEEDLGPEVHSYPYHQGWCAPGRGRTRIVGIGMTGSEQAAASRHRSFARQLPFSGEVVDSASGTIPYRRPPRSLVDNSLMVVGDAAFMNKPFNGEGVTSGFAACDTAVEVAAGALEKDDITVGRLWDFNRRYFRTQGADFAFLTAVLPALMSVTTREMDFLFSLPGVLTEEGARALNTDYEIKGDPAALGALPRLAAGVVRGDLSAGSLGRVALYAGVASVLKAMYLRYPERPMDLGPWWRRVARLWGIADRGRHGYFDQVRAESGEQDLLRPKKEGRP